MPWEPQLTLCPSYSLNLATFSRPNHIAQFSRFNKPWLGRCTVTVMDHGSRTTPRELIAEVGGECSALHWKGRWDHDMRGAIYIKQWLRWLTLPLCNSWLERPHCLFVHFGLYYLFGPTWRLLGSWCPSDAVGLEGTASDWSGLREQPSVRTTT